MRTFSSIAGLWRNRRRSLVTRLVAFGVLMVVVGAASRLLFLSSFLREQIETLSASHQLSIATYVAHDIDEKIKARLDLLRTTAGDLPAALLSDPEGLQAWLKQRRDASPLFSRGMAVVPADGHGTTAEYPPAPALRGMDFSSRDWFRESRDGGTPVIGRPGRSALDGEPIIIMAAPVPGPGGRPAAVLAGITALAAPGFLNLVQENRIGRGGGFLLVSPRDHLFVAAHTPRMVLADTPPPGVNLLHDRAMAGFRGTGITVNAAGVEELAAMVSVPTPGWFLVARLPTAEAFEAIPVLQRTLLSNSLIILIVVIITVLVVVRHILRPLTDAAQQMHGMADGTIPLAPLPVRRRDEVGDLAQGFNYLLGKLREQEDALRKSEARMAHMAHHDPLTGLPNRAMFQDRLRQAIARAERAGTRFALMYIDLDGFKPINDTHGHAAGDHVLRGVAARLATALCKADTAARIGGDEFAVLLMEQDDARAAAGHVAARFRDAMTTPLEVDGAIIPVGLSLGIAVYPEDGTDARRLLMHADKAMYADKRAATLAPRPA